MSLPGGARPIRAADEEYADAYADGYAEGLREALREMLQHAARGHTAHELRFLIESRLARIDEDVALKRRSLLAPPRRLPTTPMFRSSGAPPPAAAAAPSAVARGESVVVFEDAPERALSLVAQSAGAYPCVVAVGFHRPALRGVPAEKLRYYSVADGADGEPARPESILGQVAESMGADGGALVYCDALEALATTIRADGALKFVQWLAAEAARTGSGLVVSVGPRSFADPERSTLRRLFARQV